MAIQIFEPILGTVDEFLSYALLLVSIMIIYYVIKLILVRRSGAAERDAADDERRGKFLTWAKEKKKKMDEGSARERKQKEEEVVRYRKQKEEERARERKRNLASPIKENIVQTIEACSEAIRYIDQKQSKEVVQSVKDISKELHHAWSNLRSLRRNVERTERDAVHDILVIIEANRQKIEKEVVKQIPKRIKVATTPGKKGAPLTFTSNADSIREAINGVRVSLGAAFKKLEEFHK